MAKAKKTKDSRSSTGLWKGFTRPVWRDRAAWAALGLSVVIVVLQVPFWDLDGNSTWGWVGIGISVGLSVMIGFALVGTVVGFFRGFKIGVIEGLEERDGDLEAKARSVGRVVGKIRGRK